jgi:hypothetical protein
MAVAPPDLPCGMAGDTINRRVPVTFGTSAVSQGWSCRSARGWRFACGKLYACGRRRGIVTPRTPHEGARCFHARGQIVKLCTDHPASVYRDSGGWSRVICQTLPGNLSETGLRKIHVCFIRRSRSIMVCGCTARQSRRKSVRALAVVCRASDASSDPRTSASLAATKRK